MKVKVRRTKMAGINANSYDVIVPKDEVPAYVNPSYFVSENGKLYVPYEMATVTKDHCAMPKGYERYDNYLEHEKKAKQEMLDIIKRAFPETSSLTEYPTLWVMGTNLDHAYKYLTVNK